MATAWAPDGMVEAIEDPRSDRFVLGVQWHPELGWQRDGFARALFERFVEEAATFAARRARPGNVHPILFVTPLSFFNQYMSPPSEQGVKDDR